MPYDAEQRRKRYLEKRDELIAYQKKYYSENKERCQEINTEWYRKFREEHREEFRARMRAYYRKAHPKRPTPIRYSKPPKPPKPVKVEQKKVPVLVQSSELSIVLVTKPKEKAPKFEYQDASFSMTLE
jgi:hypothetical protein